MRCFFTNLLIVFLTFSAAHAIEPVIIRADGFVVDSSGDVIGVPNLQDSRNSPYERYYYIVDSEGNFTNGSAFKVTSNPHTFGSGGFIRIDVKSEISGEFETKTTIPSSQISNIPEPEVPLIFENNGESFSYNNQFSSAINTQVQNFGSGQNTGIDDNSTNNSDIIIYNAPQNTGVSSLGSSSSGTVSFNNDNVSKSRYDFGGGQPSRYGDF